MGETTKLYFFFDTFADPSNPACTECDMACGECNMVANNCTTCRGTDDKPTEKKDGGDSPDSGKLYECVAGGGGSGDDSFSIFDHPWWLALIGLFLVAVIVAAYFMFRSKDDEDEDDHKYEMSGSEK